MPRRRKVHDELPGFAIDRLDRKAALLDVEILDALGWLNISTPHHTALLQWRADCRRVLNVLNGRPPNARPQDGGALSGHTAWGAPGSSRSDE